MPDKPRILVVDDEVLAAMAIGEFLGSRGFHVTIAPDGLEALARFEDDSFAAVITDLRMPRMDGHSLIRVLRQHRPDLPVIVMTGYLCAGAEENAILEQPVPIPVLRKPVSLQEVAEVLCGCLSVARS